MTTNNDAHATRLLQNMMVRAIGNRHQAARIFREVAGQIEGGFEHHYGPEALAEAIGEALARTSEYALSPGEDPYEIFAQAIARIRSESPSAGYYAQRAAESANEEYDACSCDSCTDSPEPADEPCDCGMDHCGECSGDGYGDD